jgi:hypothetical protein
MSSIATTNETSNVTSLPTAPKPQTSKEVIAANVKLLIEQLEAGHSEGLTAYLTAMGKFHNYSFGNILEIARQMPSASRIAGLYAWNQLGRNVKKGQKGIRILAPMLGTKRKKDSEAEKDITKQNRPVLVGFRAVYQRSSIMFPRVLTPFTYPRGFHTRRVATSGDISWHKDRVFISQVFSFEDLGFEEMDEEIFRVYFREIELGELDVTELRFRPVRALP